MNIIEAIKFFFEDLIIRIEYWRDFIADTFFGGIFAFLKYVWFYCIPAEITDMFFLFIYGLIFFALIKKAR